MTHEQRDSCRPVAALADLHDLLRLPIAESMNFLNEVAIRFPKAISFAAGRPFEGFFDVKLIHHYLDVYVDYLTTELRQDETQVRATLMQYGPTKGIINDVVARNLAVDEGIHVEPDSLVVTVGCQEALYLVLRALRKSPEDVLLAICPTYVGVAGAAQLVDMAVLPVQASPRGIDFDDLLAVIRRATAAGLRPRACYVNPDFANPTGVSLDLTDREHLLRIAEEYDFLLLEDNPYGLFASSEKRLPTLKALDTAQRVVYLGSYAKSVFPGARIGFAVADQHLVGPDGECALLADQLAKIKSMLTVNTSPIAQAVIGGKLIDNDYSLHSANYREIQVYQQNLQLMLEELSKLFPDDANSAVSWNIPEGGFFLALTVPFEADDALLEYSAREHDVLWTPMRYFHADGAARNQLRLSFSHLTPAQIRVGLQRLWNFTSEKSGS